MTELRWILAAVGAVLVLGVYLWGRRQGGDTSESAGFERQSPPLGNVDDPNPNPFAAREAAPSPPPADSDPLLDVDTASADEAVTQGDAQADDEPAPAKTAEKVIKIHLLAGETGEFDATELVAALRAEGLRFGHFDIFHRFTDEGNPGPNSEPLFSVANMLKPGTFELSELRGATMKGASLFLVLPGPADAVAAFADMLATGRRLAATLGGQLVDAEGCHISRQRASHMREDIINYQLAAKIAGEQLAQS